MYIHHISNLSKVPENVIKLNIIGTLIVDKTVTVIYDNKMISIINLENLKLNKQVIVWETIRLNLIHYGKETLESFDNYIISINKRVESYKKL